MQIFERKIASTDFLNFSWGVSHGKLVEIINFFIIVKISKNDIGLLTDTSTLYWTYFERFWVTFWIIIRKKHLGSKIGIGCETGEFSCKFFGMKGYQKISTCSSHIVRYPKYYWLF